LPERAFQVLLAAVTGSDEPDPYAVVRAQNAAASRKSVLPLQSAESGNPKANAPHKFTPA
jgi:hypothetical protein